MFGGNEVADTADRQVLATQDPLRRLQRRVPVVYLLLCLAMLAAVSRHSQTMHTAWLAAIAALIGLSTAGLWWWLRGQASRVARLHRHALDAACAGASPSPATDATPVIGGDAGEVAVCPLQDAGQRLQHRDAACRDLMQVLPDGALLLDCTQVRHANPACAAAFGRGGEAMQGLPLEALVVPDDVVAFRAWLDQAHPGPETPPQRMSRADGTVFRAALTASRMSYEGVACTLVVVRDLSEVERMRDALAARNDELHALAARIFTVQEDERRAISRELHDDIGQSVTAIKLSAGNVLGEPDPERRRDDLEDILLVADATLEKLRDISVLLRPPQLDALGLEAALRWHAGRMLRAPGMAVELDIAELAHRPSREVEQACFRIAQEALTNIVRHAGAQRVALRLLDDEDGLRLYVHDDGAGFHPAAAKGLGVVIMRERAQVVGGHLTVSSAPHQGTRIDAWLPYPARAEAHARHPAGARHH